MAPSHLRAPVLGRLPTVTTVFLAALSWSVAGQVHAQAVPSVSPAASEITPIERAKRDAEKVFQWIRLHSDKPRRSSPQAANERAASPAAPVAARRVQAQAVAKPPEIESSPTPPEDAPVPTAHAAASQAAPAASQAPTVGAALPAASDDTVPVATAPVAPAPEEDLPLVAQLQTEPDFPASLMRQLRKGTVQVAFTVQPDGSVAQARSLSSTHPRLVRIALATVSQWRFQPLRHAQPAVVELGFNLEE